MFYYLNQVLNKLKYNYYELTSYEYGLITKEHTAMHTIEGLNWPSGFILQCLSNKTLPVAQGQNSYCKARAFKLFTMSDANHLYNVALNLLLIFKP